MRPLPYLCNFFVFFWGGGGGGEGENSYFGVGALHCSRKPHVCSYGTGKDDDHDQDVLSKDVLHIRSWSSENLFLKRRKTMTMTKIDLRKVWYAYGYGPLLLLFHLIC